jgi:hypothetical protein
MQDSVMIKSWMGPFTSDVSGGGWRLVGSSRVGLSLGWTWPPICNAPGLFHPDLSTSLHYVRPSNSIQHSHPFSHPHLSSSSAARRRFIYSPFAIAIAIAVAPLPYKLPVALDSTHDRRIQTTNIRTRLRISTLPETLS